MNQDNLNITASAIQSQSESTKPKHAGGRPRYNDVPVPDSMSEAITIANINIVKVLKVIYNAAVGNKTALGTGVTYTNGNGTQIPLMPNIDAAKWLVEQTFGKAAAREIAEKDKNDIIKMFAKRTHSVLKQKNKNDVSNTTVSTDGKISVN